ncbi:putative bacteriocin export ABC transporter [Clostridioides sp. ES-S-0108-01]|uniref:putative bacteriocin export ABC transporter n=1 Tax=unclassified Clostridioides TaxID=2635829 RepID=UPI001D0C8898|nr:putative bacteriocin export ABC transporter [Clostridioides sp. ES-S-0171-01]MCC0688238.1 putative bacteriocin export ABC transporter [Clostridioides sp. ES-S-0056-01]MCC0715851.1 putative bacteriocin export ABC transporter [Clostridioides sp. ES-S-0077-01]MCC0782626.1 putative bacteriocin export ABC transporter [Clostridioides sp. ES-S-0108-01]UDN50820.1 putative bacteriocin export ABC transporter [Clostridioides sp. ES-S-0107-01]UDN54316.1 putative bacteriocin export ABC transporter [Clos
MNNICKLTNITKFYKDKEVFNNINLEIKKGEMLAITGKSGTGKSTILNIIGLLDKVDSGNIELFGKDVTNLSRRNKEILLRNKISYLFQNFALIDNYTIGKNLDVALYYSKMNKKDKELLKLRVLKDLDLEISLNKKIYSLSGGEQQRIALARILLKPSELILADEPTGSLDSKAREKILSTLKLLNDRGKTIVIVTHDDIVANICSRTISIDK